MEITVRQSNYELLRIISMVMIIAFHVSCHGKWDGGGVFYPIDLTANTFFLQCFVPFGKIGVNLYVLISGYFLILSSKSTWPKLVKLWIQMLFYSITICVFFYFINGDAYSLETIVWALTPTVSLVWWFASTYLIMLALSPFINKALLSCEEKNHIALIIGLIILWSVIPTFTNKIALLNDLGWFITLYIIAAYFRLYPRHFQRSASHYLVIALAAYIAIMAVTYYVDSTHYSSSFWTNSSLLYHNHLQNNIMILIVSLSVFLAFSKINIGQNKTINAVASTTFGIYLVHDHDFVRWKIYSDVFDCFGHTYSELLIPYVLFIIATIFAVCMVIDFARQLLFDKFLLKNLSEKVLVIQSKIDSYIERKLNGNDRV